MAIIHRVFVDVKFFPPNKQAKNSSNSANAPIYYKREIAASDGECMRTDLYGKNNLLEGGKQMRKHTVALILSSIYCGLGQIYRRRIVKGINFAVIYSLLIASYFLSTSFLRGLNLLAILLMWIMGVMDSYMDRKLRRREERSRRQRWQAIMSFSVIFCAIMTLLVPRILAPPIANERQVDDTRNTATSLENESTTVRNSAEVTSEADPEVIVEASTENNIEANPVVPQKENTAIVDYNISPTTAKPGATLTIEYIVNAHKDMTLGLGFSIQRAKTHKWLSDPGNDKVVNVSAGSGKYYRNFVIPAALRPGEYNAVCGLWNSDYTVKLYSRQSDSVLNIVTSPTAGDRDYSLDIFSVQVATFRKAENAEKLYNKLLSKGYPARIEYPRLPGEGFHVVLVGESYNRQSAVKAAKELREREGFSDLVIRHHSSEGVKLISDAFSGR